jgi:hypothetical protein
MRSNDRTDFEDRRRHERATNLQSELRARAITTLILFLVEKLFPRQADVISVAELDALFNPL